MIFLANAPGLIYVIRLYKGKHNTQQYKMHKRWCLLSNVYFRKPYCWYSLLWFNNTIVYEGISLNLSLGILSSFLPTFHEQEANFLRCLHVLCRAVGRLVLMPAICSQTSDKIRTLVGNKIVDLWDVVGGSPVGAAPSISSFSTRLNQWIEIRQLQDWTRNI